MHLIEFIAEKVPPGQLAQTEVSSVTEEDAPGRAYFPAEQETATVQSLEVSPLVEPYLPAEHKAQTLTSVRVLDVAPGNAYLPAGHVTTPEQSEDVLPPVPNFPAGHIVH